MDKLTLLRQRWRRLLASRGVNESLADRSFADIAAKYSEPGRFYHNLDHVWSVLHTVATLASSLRDPAAVELAAWLHDVIYDSKANDNEERSADYARKLCGQLTLPWSERVADLILKTKTHASSDDRDAMVLLDADLAILGQNESTYAKYALQIRQEFAWVSDENYRLGRRQVLENFLARPRIYHLLTHLESTARHNLNDEIRGLARPNV